MKRKAFLNCLALGSGGTVLLPASSLLQSCEYKPKMRTNLTEADVELLDELGETIIPATASSPGAKAANIGAYMLLMYRDCLPVEKQDIFLAGLNTIDKKSSEMFSRSFINADAALKLHLLESVQEEAIQYHRAQGAYPNPLPHYFDIMKGLVLSGYFTSEIGMTQAREYLPLPGKYEACIPYTPAKRPWAT